MRTDKKIVVVMQAYNAALTLRRFKQRIGEVSCPARYHAEASSIGFSRSVRYTFAALSTSFKFRLQRMGPRKFRIFKM